MAQCATLSGGYAISVFLIYGSIVAGLFMMVMIRPAAALAAVLGMYGLDQWSIAKSPFFIEHHAVTNVAMGVIVVAALVRRFMQRSSGTPWQYPLAGWLTIALFGFAALSLIWSIAPDYTIAVYRSHLPYVITIVLLMPLTINSLKDVRYGLYATLAVGLVLVPLLTFTTEWHGRAVETVFGSAAGQNPLETGSLGARIFLLAVLLNFRRMARLWQVLRWGLGAVAVMLVIHSGSRGQFLAMFAVAVVLLPFSRRFSTAKGAASAIAGLVVAVVLMITILITVGQSSRWNLSPHHIQTVYTSTRVQMVETLLTHWLYAGPIRWVIGLGNSTSYSPSLIGIYPHFVPAQVLGEEGLIGLALLLAILWIAARSMIRVYRHCVPFDDARGVAVALASLFLFDFLLSLKEGSMVGNPNLFAWAIILGQVELSLHRWRQTAQLPTSNVPLGGALSKSV